MTQRLTAGQCGKTRDYRVVGPAQEIHITLFSPRLSHHHRRGDRKILRSRDGGWLHKTTWFHTYQRWNTHEITEIITACVSLSKFKPDKIPEWKWDIGTKTNNNPWLKSNQYLIAAKKKRVLFKVGKQKSLGFVCLVFFFKSQELITYLG